MNDLWGNLLSDVEQRASAVCQKAGCTSPGIGVVIHCYGSSVLCHRHTRALADSDVLFGLFADVLVLRRRYELTRSTATDLPQAHIEDVLAGLRAAESASREAFIAWLREKDEPR